MAAYEDPAEDACPPVRCRPGEIPPSPFADDRPSWARIVASRQAAQRLWAQVTVLLQAAQPRRRG